MIPPPPSAPSLLPTTASPSLPLLEHAVSLPHMSGLLRALFDSPLVDALAALPVQAHVLVVAARALAEREARRVVIAAEVAANNRAGANADIGTYEGAPSISAATASVSAVAASSTSGKRGPGRPGSPSPSSPIAVVGEASASSTAITLGALQAAYTAVCRRRLLTPVAAVEFGDLIDRLVADGILAPVEGGRGVKGGASLVARAGGGGAPAAGGGGSAACVCWCSPMTWMPHWEMCRCTGHWRTILGREPCCWGWRSHTPRPRRQRPRRGGGRRGVVVVAGSTKPSIAK